MFEDDAFLQPVHVVDQDPLDLQGPQLAGRAHRVDVAAALHPDQGEDE